MTEMQTYNPYIADGKLLIGQIESFKIAQFGDLERADELLKKCQKLKKEIEEKRVEITKPLNDQVKQINNLAKEVSIPVEEAEGKIKAKIIERNRKQEEIRIAKEKAVQEAIKSVQACTTLDELSGLIFEVSDPRIESAILIQKGEIERRIRDEEERLKRVEEEKRLQKIKEEQSEESARLEAEKLEIERQQRELEAERKRLEDEKRQEELRKEEERKAKMRDVEQAAVKPKGMRKQVKFEIIDETLVPANLCSPDEKKIREYVKNGVKEIPGVRVWEEDNVW